MGHKVFERKNFTSWEICGMLEELVFEWDIEKEWENILFHGVYFDDAAEPFERRIYYGNSEIHGWQRINH